MAQTELIYYFHRGNRYYFRNGKEKLVVTMSPGHSLPVKHYGESVVYELN